jgi:hypothetical protein
MQYSFSYCPSFSIAFSFKDVPHSYRKCCTDFFTKSSNYLQINSKKIAIFDKLSIRFNEQLLKLAWNAIAIHNDKGEVVEIQGVSRDITEQQAALRECQLADEAALRQSEKIYSAQI